MLDSNSTLRSDSQNEVAVPARLVERVRAVLDAPSGTSPRIVRVTAAGSGEESLHDWLRARAGAEAVYWSGRDDDGAVAAVGAADVVATDAAPLDYTALQHTFDNRLKRATAPVRYFGGIRFDAGHAPRSSGEATPWAPFGTARFVLPRLELREEEGQRTWACNLVLPRDQEQADALLSSLRSPSSTPAGATSLPRPIERTDRPNREQWTDMVEWALEAIREGGLDKVVLARRVALSMGVPLDPFLMLHHLQADTPGCFHFAVRPAEGPAFVGASPERLLRREGPTIQSEAIAGTRSRGDSAQSDAALRDELMDSAKERREHAFVQDAIRKRLDGLCTNVDAAEAPTDLTLSRRRHLHAPLTGTLRPSVSTGDVLDALHPTPAVGGVPTEAALDAIRTQEPFDRGWYAGPVGWIGADAAEFAVGIRAGLVHDADLTLFSGAGIVEGSVPEREWDEIEQKIEDFAALLGGTETNGEA